MLVSALALTNRVSVYRHGVATRARILSLCVCDRCGGVPLPRVRGASLAYD
ncbi:MAG: hypothetical protein JWM69_549 [Candidatus Binatus sp.]|nr:hypothetical protein [Candidatus Binatus sp.]